MTTNNSKFLVFKNDRLILPNDLIPIQYDLHVTPNFREFTFFGSVDVHVKVIKGTQRVVLHCLDIEIQSAKINGQSASKIEYYEPEEVVIIDLDETLVPTNTNDKPIILSFEYKGQLNDKMVGFYRSKYTVDNQDRYMASTQFEPTDARRAFPCFDEPSLKAIFNIKLTIDSNLKGLSNMQEISCIDNKNGTKTITFDKTPIMSTYIVAFVVGDLEFIEGSTKDGIKVRIYKAIGQEGSCEFALDISTKCLNFFTNYFEIPYTINKLDSCAIPSFNLGAMENWGLVTYREDLLLTTPQTTLSMKKDIAEVICHELAHQWFGNLVTMEWWSQLWLNEGFAQFMGCLVTHTLFPEWGYWLNFSSTYLESALSLDALDNTHPIEVPVVNSSQINEIFDDISYDKGACIIRMMDGRYGENFRKGIVHYLKKHQYKNTKTEDLWDSIGLISGTDTKNFIDSFTKKSGYPVISFKPTHLPGTFELTQKKFSYHPTSNNDDTQIWNCFIKIQTDQSIHEVLLDKKTALVKIPNWNPNTSWMKPNANQTGFYRIEYDPSIIKSLKSKLNQLQGSDRLGLISDCFHLSTANILPISTYMDLISAFSEEKESSIWRVIMKQLNLIKNLSHGEPYHAKLCQFICKLLKPSYNRLGFDPKPNEPTTDILQREIVNNELGDLGDTVILAECKKRFTEFIENPNSLPTDIITVVLNTVMINGGEPEQNELITQYLTSNNTSLKCSLQAAISNTTDEKLIQKALDFSLSENVRSQDTYASWYSIPSIKRDTIWKYFTSKFQEINKVFSISSLYHYMITSSIPIKMNESQCEIVEEFFQKHPIPIAERTIKQDLERIKIHSLWFQNFNPILSKWIDEQQI